MKKFLKNKRLFTISIFCMALFIGAVFTSALYKEKFNVFYKNVDKTQEATELKNIPIAMAADDNYTYPTIVSITSLIINSKNDTSYDIHIMTQGGFNQENKQKLLSLQEKYKDKCTINLIDMKDRYKNAYDKGHITTPAYYRLSLSSVLPDAEKVIWLDGDTLIFEDLTNLINIDMEDFYYKGFLDENVDGLADFGIKDDCYICSGVMLVNLKKLRQDNIEEKFEEFIIKNNNRLKQHDQTVINAVCYKNIGILPAKYGIFNFENLKKARDYVGILKNKNKYTIKEMEKALLHPAILHCIWKPWWNNGNAHNQELWLKYAEKTEYFDEIIAKYNL